MTLLLTPAPCVGIGLFTHHKYQKTVHSAVPLDAHGNPIPLAGEGADVDVEEVEALEVFDARYSGDDDAMTPNGGERER